MISLKVPQSRASPDPNLSSLDDNKRFQVYLAYLLFTLIMLPVWWYTTSVPRVSLVFPPSERHRDLLRLSKLRVILINVEEEAWTTLLGQELELTPNPGEQSIPQADEEEFTVEVLHKTLVSFARHDRLKDESEFDRIEFEDLVKRDFGPASTPDRIGEYRLYLVGGTARKMSIHYDGFHRAILMAGASHDKTFGSPQEFLEKWLVHLICSPQHARPKDHNSGRLSDAARYLVTLTMVVGYVPEDTQISKLDWDIETAAREHLLPLLASLEKLADFSVNYQIKAMARLPVTPKGSGERGHLLDPGQLPIFVDETRWNFASTTVGAEVVTIDLLLFVPSPGQQPLLIEGRGDDPSFRLAQWGAVYILNVPPTSEGRISAAQLQPVMASFAGHLRSLFGIGLYEGNFWPEGVSRSASLNNQDGVTPFELDSLMTDLCLRRYRSALSTLHALQRLLNQYGEIAVLPPVGKLVNDALASLALTQGLWAEGNWGEALVKAAHAQQLADAAFFHPTMMAHQYFPQEHKLGVYLPLLFPFVLPIIVATISGILAWAKHLRRGREREREKQQ